MNLELNIFKHVVESLTLLKVSHKRGGIQEINRCINFKLNIII